MIVREMPIFINKSKETCRIKYQSKNVPILFNYFMQSIVAQRLHHENN